VHDFRISPNARRRHVVQQALKILIGCFCLLHGLRFLRGAPLLSFTYFDITNVLLVLALFFVRVRWGDRLLFDGSILQVYQGKKLRWTIPLGSLEKVSRGESSLTVAWVAHGRTERLLLTKEGFTDDQWKQIRSLLSRMKGA
jgi:hypothetical protein